MSYTGWSEISRVFFVMAALAATVDLEKGKLQEKALQIFRDTTGPIKSQRHVFEATTSIGK